MGAVPTAQKASAEKIAQEALDKFADKGGSKGIQVKYVPFVNTADNIAAILGGTGTDVVYDYNYAQYIEDKLFVPMETYIKDAGISDSIWSAGQLNVYKEGGHLYAVPAYMGTVCYAVNTSLLDSLGQAYPTSDWTSDTFVSFCQTFTGTTTSGAKRYGGMLYQWDNEIDGSRWIFNAFNGALMNADGTKSTLSAPGSLAAGEWMFQQLYWPGICTTRNINYAAAFGAGTLVMRTMGTWEILPAVTDYQDSFQWIFLPFPIFSAGRTTFSTDDFYAVNVESKHIDEAAEVALWASSSTYWNTFNMQLQLISPARVDLWDDWISVVKQAAPPLANQDLSWYADAAQKGYALAPLYYRYNDPECEAAVNAVISSLYTQSSTDVATAFASADAQVDAILEAGASAAASSTASSGSSSTSSSVK